jgi:hypothetical protein
MYNLSHMYEDDSSWSGGASCEPWVEFWPVRNFRYPFFEITIDRT